MAGQRGILRGVAIAGVAVAAVAGGIAANVALLGSDASDGMGRLVPVLTATDAEGGVVPSTRLRTATVRTSVSPARTSPHRPSAPPRAVTVAPSGDDSGDRSDDDSDRRDEHDRDGGHSSDD